jgi:transcriptional regulator with XRE-family HTH domain
MKRRNEQLREEIEETTAMFRAVRRLDVALQLRSKMAVNEIRASDIAQRLNVSEANVSRWLRGDQNLTLDTLYLLADAVEMALEIKLTSPVEDGTKLNGFQAEAGVDTVSAKQTQSCPATVVWMDHYRDMRAKASRPANSFHLPQSEMGIDLEMNEPRAATN